MNVAACRNGTTEVAHAAVFESTFKQYCCHNDVIAGFFAATVVVHEGGGTSGSADSRSRYSRDDEVSAQSMLLEEALMLHSDRCSFMESRR